MVSPVSTRPRLRKSLKAHRRRETWHNDYSCLPPFWTFRELSPSTCRESRDRPGRSHLVRGRGDREAGGGGRRLHRSILRSGIRGGRFYRTEMELLFLLFDHSRRKRPPRCRDTDRCLPVVDVNPRTFYALGKVGIRREHEIIECDIHQLQKNTKIQETNPRKLSVYIIGARMYNRCEM